MGEKTNRDHEDDANDVSLISRLRVIEKVPVDVKYRQGNGSNSAQKRDDVEIKRYQIRHICKTNEQKEKTK